MLASVDYFNPDDEHTPGNLKHLVFIKPQVFMFTPEEVYSASRDEVPWGAKDMGRAAIACLGRTKWLESFDPTHLGKCRHFRVMFYDYTLDIVCERIDARGGGYAA